MGEWSSDPSIVVQFASFNVFVSGRQMPTAEYTALIPYFLTAVTRLVMTMESSAAEAVYTKFSIDSLSGTAVVPRTG